MTTFVRLLVRESRALLICALDEYKNGDYGDGTALGRVHQPDREISSLQDYREYVVLSRTSLAIS